MLWWIAALSILPKVRDEELERGKEWREKDSQGADHEESNILTLPPSLPPSSPAVQHECIPQAILGMDIICQAKSGMGKTAVFVLSTLHLLEPKVGIEGGREGGREEHTDRTLNTRISSSFPLLSFPIILQDEECPSVIVIGHTRELAFQISKEYARFGKYLPQVRLALPSLPRPSLPVSF